MLKSINWVFPAIGINSLMITALVVCGEERKRKQLGVGDYYYYTHLVKSREPLFSSCVIVRPCGGNRLKVLPQIVDYLRYSAHIC